MTERVYRESAYGVPKGYRAGAYRAEAEALLDRMGDWPAISRLEAEASWQTADENGNALPEPVYRGLAVRAYEDRATTIGTEMIFADRVRRSENPRIAYTAAKRAAEAIDRKRMVDARDRAREQFVRYVELAGRDGVTAEMVVDLIFGDAWALARDLYREAREAA